jgi:hypothetical protein
LSFAEQTEQEAFDMLSCNIFNKPKPVLDEDESQHSSPRPKKESMINKLKGSLHAMIFEQISLDYEICAESQAEHDRQ